MKTPRRSHQPSARLSLLCLASALLCAAPAGAQQAQNRPTQSRDAFYWLGEQNKASLIMLTEEGIVSKELGAKIAQSITQVLADGNKPGATRSGNYLAVEEDMIKIGGPDVSRLHSGRSRQDLGQSSSRLFMREAVLESFDEFVRMREVLLNFAEKHATAIVPFYTWGVQAQPTSFGHYLGGYVQAFTRGADRYKQAWTRLNLSPLGGAAGGTSSFPVNRPRLAELLGYDGLVVNSFDSGQISQLDTSVEFVNIASANALLVGMLAADLTDQYSDPHPWIMIEEGELTGGSSIMPQKRNPTGLTSLRGTASGVTAQAQGYILQSTNVRSGMGDYKGDVPLNTTRASTAMYRAVSRLFGSLVFDEARGLEEVNRDYSTTTELADILQRDADVPFRIGHHFASDIVTYGRSKKLRPSEIPYNVAQQLFTDASKYFGIENAKLPLTEAQFRRALTAENMVESAKVVGGPQPAEVKRMLAAERARLQADRDWIAATRAKLDEAARKRDAGVAQLMGGR